jgi:hypothetical protein
VTRPLAYSGRLTAADDAQHPLGSVLGPLPPTSAVVVGATHVTHCGRVAVVPTEKAPPVMRRTAGSKGLLPKMEKHVIGAALAHHEVTGSVIGAVAIHMVNLSAERQGFPERLLYEHQMLQHPPLRISSGMTREVMRHVAVTYNAHSFPPSVGSGSASKREAKRGDATRCQRARARTTSSGVMPVSGGGSGSGSSRGVVTSRTSAPDSCVASWTAAA